MFQGYLELGGDEVLNQGRAYGYMNDGECPVGWLQCSPCDGLDDALGDAPYTDIVEAPWYDADEPVSGRFYGAYPITISGMSDTTRTATVTEGILDGGVIQGGRREVRRLRATALLVANGMDALEYGMSWLSAALDPAMCSTHGGTCGEADLCFFVDCPTPRGPDEDEIDYQLRVDSLVRQMHGVVTISGPIVTDTLHRGTFWGYLVEFTLAAGNPYIYSLTRQIELTPTPAAVFQDSPVNLVPYPSAELADAASITLATNYSTNPSVETNTTGWAFEATSVGGTSPTTYMTSGQTTEVVGVGLQAFRARLLGNNGSPVTLLNTALITVYQQVSLAGLPATARPSISIFAGVNLVAGATTVVGPVVIFAQWRTGTTVLSETVLGSYTDPALVAKAYSARAAALVGAADNVRVGIRATVVWSSQIGANNTDVRVIADAVSVTVP